MSCCYFLCVCVCVSQVQDFETAKKRTVLIERAGLAMKGPHKGTAPSNDCFSTTWKLFSGIVITKPGRQTSQYIKTALKDVVNGTAGQSISSGLINRGS